MEQKAFSPFLPEVSRKPHTELDYIKLHHKGKSDTAEDLQIHTPAYLFALVLCDTEQAH